MKTLSLILFLQFFTNFISGQISIYQEYIDSFQEYKSNDIISAGKISQIQNNMSKDEAVAFVYDGDTAKLFCYQKIYSMETEKVEGISRDLYLPNKSLRIDMGSYFWVAYSFFQCQNPNELLKVITVLMIVNKQYQICDKLLIYIGSDYGQDLTGLINPRNCKVFLYGISNDKNQSATIYKVNPDNLKFEKQQEDHNLNGNIDDLNATIEMLGWESYFK